MFIYYNPNPKKNMVGDCVIRALSRALNQSWDDTYAQLTAMGYMLGDMPNANHVWGAFLRTEGYERELMPDDDIYTVSDFCKDHPRGTYILAIPGHVVCVVDGDYYDTWDSGKEIPMYFWKEK